MSVRISPSNKPQQLYNFVKIDLESGFQNESYQQILKYNDYENLLKLFAKQQSGPGNEYINLDHSILLFDFVLTLMEHDKIGAVWGLRNWKEGYIDDDCDYGSIGVQLLEIALLF